MRFLGLFFKLYASGAECEPLSVLNFYDSPSILGSYMYFKFWYVSFQTILEILRISEKDWQLLPRFFNFPVFSFFWVSGPPRGKLLSVYLLEILRISKNDWQLIPQFSENIIQQHKCVCKKLSIKIKFTGEPLTPCHSFLEILGISEKVWYELHQNLKWLSKIEVKISCDSPFNR